MESVNEVNVETKPTSRKGLSFSGIVAVFYRPADFFAEIKENPKVLVPYLSLLIIILGFFYVSGDLIVDMQLNNPKTLESLEKSGMSMEQMRAMLWWSTFAGGSFSMMLAPLLIASLAMFFGNFVFAGRASFKQLLSVSLYGEILYMIGSLLHLPLMLVKGSMEVTYSLAILVADQGMQSPLYQVLSKFSVFHIWEIIVFGIGLSVIYALPRKKGYILSLLSLGLMIAIGTALSALGTMFS